MHHRNDAIQTKRTNEMFDVSPNCYVAAAAIDENTARAMCVETFFADGPDALTLVHIERAENADECDTYVFSFFADNDDFDYDECEMLYDHYELPTFENLPIEFA
jgi:hypothetical protein